MNPSAQDIGVKASNVVADKDVTLAAGGNVRIEAGTNSQTQTSYSALSESGLMSSGGLDVSIGSRDQSTDQKNTRTTAAASTVGSTGGNVSITAGKTYTQTGSDVLATGNLDNFKLGGTRVDLDLLCGAGNERCKTNPDGTFDLKNGQIQFTAKDQQGNPMSIDDFLKTPEGKKMSGDTGGVQGAAGTLFGVPYAPGSWQDKLIEAFAGTHDYLGGSITGLYDKDGNIKRGMTDRERAIYDKFVTMTAIPFSAPFAAAQGLPPEVWKAIAILLKAAR